MRARGQLAPIRRGEQRGEEISHVLLVESRGRQRRGGRARVDEVAREAALERADEQLGRLRRDREAVLGSEVASRRGSAGGERGEEDARRDRRRHGAQDVVEQRRALRRRQAREPLRGDAVEHLLAHGLEPVPGARRVRERRARRERRERAPPGRGRRLFGSALAKRHAANERQRLHDVTGRARVAQGQGGARDGTPPRGSPNQPTHPPARRPSLRPVLARANEATEIVVESEKNNARKDYVRRRTTNDAPHIRRTPPLAPPRPLGLCTGSPRDGFLGSLTP